ncbi:Cleavage/polyadenylation specificity factor A subunit [Cryptosporidium hominis]|uniref:Cleavage/polyadenylation specificity factor A subunit n=1 Tax=Cryptosporidium hominis TaxID=237895 RepID=A0ABX5BIN9_CRYHO|nr:Cleavage/polyadenylation specificity factor A subunit [Cryptosporidium hominis]|eukprot:PPS98329.1 Cleavage/polyadenylation specificity factor A subunit [Cryptosporidium hominis]
MTAVFDTYCSSERPEFSVFGHFVGRRDEQDSRLNLSLVKSNRIELYEVTNDKKIRFITSSILLQTPVACTTLKGHNGMPDYIVLLFAHWEIMIYRYSNQYGELELVSKDQIEIGDFARGASLKFSRVIEADDNIKLEQILIGARPNCDDLILMITSPKYLLFITYRLKANRNEFNKELSLGVCWGILVETDIYMDTIVDSCQILDENSNLCLQPKIAILTRIGPISTGSIQSHSNCVSLIYLTINMELTEFTVLDKLELLPMDSYKLIPFDTRRNTNICLSGGVMVLSRNSIILHGGINRPFTLITTNDSYDKVPEKKLEVDLCAQKIHGFKAKTFGFDTGIVNVDGNSTSTTSNDNSELLNTISTDNSNSNLDLRTLLTNLQPILINQPELSIEFQISYSVPFLITNEYYGILLFNQIQPYLIGLVLQLSTDQTNGIKGFHWFKVNEYWDWSRNYLSCKNDSVLCLETTHTKKLGPETILDEHYLITGTPIFRVQNARFVQNKNDSYNYQSLLLIGNNDSNSGISILDFTFNKKFTVPHIKNISSTQDPQLSYNAIVKLINSKEAQSRISDEKNKKIKRNQVDSDNVNLIQPYSETCLASSNLEDLERFYIYSDIPVKEYCNESEENAGILRDIKIRDYLDLGPNSLRDFCIIPSSYENWNIELDDEKPHKKYPVDENHSILSTNGTYPIGQLSLYEKSVSKSLITKFSLDDILFHWILNDPITSKTKYLVFTSDPLKSIGKTYFFSLDTCINSSQETFIIGDVNQLDPSEGEFDYEADSNTVGVGVIKMGNAYEDIFVIQVLPSTINVLDFGIKTRLVELDLISTLFSDNPDAPLAIKSFIMGNLIIILFEDSTIKVLKILKSNPDQDQDHKIGTEYINSLNSLKIINEFLRYQIIIENIDDLFEELNNLFEINQLVVKQRVMEGETSQLFEDEPLETTSIEERNPDQLWKNKFWIRHVSPVITNSDRNLKDSEDFLVVLVIYSKLWLNGSITIYNIAKKRLMFFSPFISAVPSIMGNILSQTGNKEEIIYRFLENEFDLGRPITSISTPIIEPKYYIAKEGGGISISSTFSLNPSGLSTSNQGGNDSNFTQSSNSYLISCELIKMEEEDSKEGNSEMILVASVSQKPILVYRLDLRNNNNSNSSRSGDFIFSRKWKLEIQTNFNHVQMDITRFFAQFPKTISSSNIQETFSIESPLSIYNCGHGISFNSKISNNVDTWIIQPPSPLDIEFRQEIMSDERKGCEMGDISSYSPSSLVIMTDKGRFSVVSLYETRTSNCIAKIDSPWSPIHILLTTSIENEINFEFLNLANTSSDPKFCNSLCTLPFPGNDNWLLRRAFLPEVVIQRVAFCKEYGLIAIIVGIPDNAKHHLNGYHIRQMAFYRYLRCLEAGGKEAQTILLNQDLIRNPDKCFEKSLASIPDLDIPPANFDSETYFDTLPPGIEIGESLPKIFYQSNMINEKARKLGFSNQSSTCSHSETENVAPNGACNGFEREQFGILMDPNIMRNELLIYSFEDLFPHLRPSVPLSGQSLDSFPKPKGRYAFGAWEVGLSMKFGQNSKGQQVLIIGTGTNPTHYYEAEGRLLMFKVKQLVSVNEEDGNIVGGTTGNGTEVESKREVVVGTTGVRVNNTKWTNMLKYWPSRFSKQLYHDNVQELDICFQSMYRGPVTSVDLINLPATTAPIAPAIPALAAYPIIQNNSIVRAPNSNVTYIAHTFGYRLYIHELRENNEGNFTKGTFMDTPLGISSVSNYKALFFLGDIRRGIHFGMLRTDASRGSQTMVKFARSHPLWKFTCTSAQAIVQDKDLAILVSDNNNNLFTFEPNFNATQIIDKETLKPTSHTSLSTSFVHMRTVESDNYRYVIASGRNGSFFSIKLTNKLQHEHLSHVEKLLCCNIPSFLGISPNTSLPVNPNLTSIPQFIQNLYPTDKIIFLKHLNYLKYLSDPILQSIFKNTNISLSRIHQFIV